jgi:hypothetical protein
MALFEKLVQPHPEMTVLDVGGFPDFWAPLKKSRPNLTIINLDVTPSESPGMRVLKGDGCALDFPDKSFDLVFSNSVIEHVGDYARQQIFAREALRVGRKIWIQTPARSFPIEPHFMTPIIHWLPRPWQRRMIRNLTVWGWLTRPDQAAADAFLNDIRLLDEPEMRALFPTHQLFREKCLGVTKSYIAMGEALPSDFAQKGA